jgi:hypothetical protein
MFGFESPENWAKATPAQLAEALLRAAGKWVEEPKAFPKDTPAPWSNENPYMEISPDGKTYLGSGD